MDTSSEADGYPDKMGAWKRWIVAGSGIWDVGSLEWLGPITDEPFDDAGERALTGPRDAPRLWLLNGRSIDVVSIRERRTMDRLATPALDRLEKPLRVSPDGDRALATCHGKLCFFRREGDGWTSHVIDADCIKARCPEAEADAWLRETVPSYRSDPGPTLVEGTNLYYGTSLELVRYQRESAEVSVPRHKPPRSP